MTFNLRIALVDVNGELVENKGFLQYIYDKIADKEIDRTVIWRTPKYEITVSVLWEKRTLTPTEQLFMGDLFLDDKDGMFGSDFMDSEYTLHRCMEFILSEIEETYFHNQHLNRCKILFHISKLLQINRRPLCEDCNQKNPIDE